MFPNPGSAALMAPPSRLRSPRSSRPPPLPGSKVPASSAARKWRRPGSCDGAIRTRAPAPPPPETERTRPKTQRGVISSSLNTTTQDPPELPAEPASREFGSASVAVAPSKATTGSKAASASRSGAARKSRPSGFRSPAGARSEKIGTSTGSPEPARRRSAAIRSSAARPTWRIEASSGSRLSDCRACRNSRRKPAVITRVSPSATTASVMVKPEAGPPGGQREAPSGRREAPSGPRSARPRAAAVKTGSAGNPPRRGSPAPGRRRAPGT